jgi:hypothetical protein
VPEPTTGVALAPIIPGTTVSYVGNAPAAPIVCGVIAVTPSPTAGRTSHDPIAPASKPAEAPPVIAAAVKAATVPHPPGISSLMESSKSAKASKNGSKKLI